MILFDAHIHLQDERLMPRISEALARAGEAGVRRMVSCGSRGGDWDALAALAGRHPMIIPSFGLHPWYVCKRAPGWKKELADFLERHPLCGVGETGLDFAIADKNEQDQRLVFSEQMALARDLQRPATIHCRKAWPALIEILEDLAPFPAGLMIHSFSGNPDLIPRLAALGCCFSFSGSITWPHNRKGPSALAAVPLDRLLIETDAPDMPVWTPGTAPGSREKTLNEPANLVQVLKRVACLRGVSEDSMAAQTYDNAARLFANG